MPDWIFTKSCSVAELFSDAYRFRLPYFQRGYAWQDVHAERLLHDILDVAEGRRQLPWYPLGSIILAKSEAAPDAGLTDGHQRLVTLTILIAILRDLETDAGLKEELDGCISSTGVNGSKEPRLVTQSKARDCLVTYVQTRGATAMDFTGDIEALGDSEANIIGNRDKLRQRLRAIAAARRKRLARFLLDHCVVVVMGVASEEIARVLFSTMHDTGLKPTPADLFKAEVLGAIDDDDRDAAQAEWEMQEATLGCDKLGVLLRQIAIIAEGKQPNGPVEERLIELFKLDRADAALQFVGEQIAGIGGKLVEVLAAQLAGNDRLSPVQRQLRFLSWVRNHDTWLAPALLWMKANGSDGRDTSKFLRHLEALAWTQMIIAGDPVQRDNRYMALLQDIKAMRGPQGREHVFRADGPLMVTEQERQEVRRILAAPNFIKRRYKQFLLLRIDAAMGDAAAPLAPPIGTVEHIYPARPGEASQWRTDFKGPQASVLRQSLGNLTLLTTADQDAAKNRDFVHKLAVYRASGFAVSRRIADYPAWTPAAVKQRTDELIDTVMKGWQLA